MPIPFYDDYAWQRKQPLKFRTGAEQALTTVLYSSTVTLDTTTARRVVAAGTVLCRITSGTGENKYGPYDKTASDGRESIAEDAAVIAVEGRDVTLGDREVGGWFAFCTFDKSQLTTNGVSLHGDSLTSLKAAFPQCKFSD